MLDAAEAAGVVHALATEFRWATGQELLRRVVRDGVDRRAARSPPSSSTCRCSPIRDPKCPTGGRTRRRAAVGSARHAPHVVDQIRTTLGEFDGVSAALSNLAPHGWTAEDGYSVRFRLRSGVDGIMQSCAGDLGPILVTTRIAGTTATAWLEGEGVAVADASGTRTVDVPAGLVLAPPDPPPADLMVTTYDLHALDRHRPRAVHAHGGGVP